MPGRYLIFLLALQLFILITPVQAKELFRWQDDKGNIHYTDQIPPQYVKEGYSVISEQGLTIKTIKAKSEEITEEETIDVVSPEQVKRDQRLLATYSNEDEIILTRERRLADIEALNELGEETISLLEMQFRQLAKEAGDYEKQGKPVPKNLLAETAATRKKIKKYQTRIEQNQEKITRLKEEFENDLQRYRELRNIVNDIDN